jgi:hypothetical protein
MSKIEQLHEIQGNIQNINFYASELLVIFQKQNVGEYIKNMDECQEIFNDDKIKVSFCMMEKTCPYELGRYYECKEKDKSICYGEQNVLEKCMKKPINQLMSILGKHKLY